MTATEQARARVVKAQAELEAAGKALLKAIGATKAEIADAKDSLADIHHEADADGWAGAEWNQMIADHILTNRQYEAEDGMSPAGPFQV